MRGDLPYEYQSMLTKLESTPHARGSTVVKDEVKIGKGVYPACAGIYPLQVLGPVRDYSLPRMRGDLP